MRENTDKTLDATNKTLPKDSLNKLGRSMKPKELGKTKQGLRNKKMDKKKKTKQTVNMTHPIAKLKQNLPLTPSEISAINEWLDEVRLENAKRREINQRKKERISQENALFYSFWDHLSNSSG